MIPAYKDKNKGTWYASFYYENWMAIKEMKINRCFAAKREVLISRATTICEIRSQDVITWKNEMLNHRDKDGKSYSPIYLKTPKSNCVIQMPAFLCEKIQEYIKTLYTVRPTDRIFSVTKSYLYREIERGSKAAGVKRIRIHDLRHSHRATAAATIAAASPVSITLLEFVIPMCITSFWGMHPISSYECNSANDFVPFACMLLVGSKRRNGFAFGT